MSATSPSRLRRMMHCLGALQYTRGFARGHPSKQRLRVEHCGVNGDHELGSSSIASLRSLACIVDRSRIDIAGVGRHSMIRRNAGIEPGATPRPHRLRSTGSRPDRRRRSSRSVLLDRHAGKHRTVVTEEMKHIRHSAGESLLYCLHDDPCVLKHFGEDYPTLNAAMVECFAYASDGCLLERSPSDCCRMRMRKPRLSVRCKGLGPQFQLTRRISIDCPDGVLGNEAERLRVPLARLLSMGPSCDLCEAL